MLLPMLSYLTCVKMVVNSPLHLPLERNYHFRHSFYVLMGEHKNLGIEFWKKKLSLREVTAIGNEGKRMKLAWTSSCVLRDNELLNTKYCIEEINNGKEERYTVNV